MNIFPHRHFWRRQDPSHPSLFWLNPLRIRSLLTFGNIFNIDFFHLPLWRMRRQIKICNTNQRLLPPLVLWIIDSCLLLPSVTMPPCLQRMKAWIMSPIQLPHLPNQVNSSPPWSWESLSKKNNIQDKNGQVFYSSPLVLLSLISPDFKRQRIHPPLTQPQQLLILPLVFPFFPFH